MKILRKILPIALMGFMSLTAVDVKAQDIFEESNIIEAQLQEIPTIDGIEIPQSNNNDITSAEKSNKEQLIQNFLVTNSKYFKNADLMLVKQKLQSMDEDQIVMLSNLNYIDPTMNLVISVLVGSLGVDRFVIGQAGWGVLKLVTLGGLGIWTIVDWFQIQNLTKKHNMKVFNEATMLI